MNFDELTPELKMKARNCKTPEDLLALVKEGGYKLSDEEMEKIAGGGMWSFSGCSYYGVE